MAVIDLFRPEDRPALIALYRRVFGNDAADGWQLRWDWQFRRNPSTPPSGPLIWVAREGPALVGHCATMPVRLAVLGEEIDASWGIDVMVAPERRRQGLGEILFGTWNKSVGAALGLGPSESSAALFQKLRWPSAGPVPSLVKPLTRRALRRATWPVGLNRLVSALAYPIVQVLARARPLSGETVLTRHFDEGFTRLWERVSPKLDLAVRRDARYLQWRFIAPPHVRYSVAVFLRSGLPAGYVVYRHAQEARSRVTLLVDFLTDPDDPEAFLTLARWVDREARANDSDKIRCYCLHAGFRKLLRQSGYFQTKSTLALVARINAVRVPDGFCRKAERWHVTLGDSDQDH